MGIDIVLRIAGIGILVAIICQLLKQTGRDDIAMLAALAVVAVNERLRLEVRAQLFAVLRP